MSIRYYLSPMVSVPDPNGRTHSWKPKVATYPIQGFSSVASSDPTAAGAWALCIVSAADHTPMLADNTVHALPDYAFDGKMGALSPAVVNAMRTVLTALGLTAADVTWTNNDGWRLVLRQIGKHHLASFSEDQFGGSLS
jgi:hypothetical protein